MVSKQFEAHLKIFKIGRKKVYGVTIGPMGGPLEKNFSKHVSWSSK